MTDSHHRTLMAMIALALAALLWVLWPLLQAIFWAIVIALVFAPFYQRLLAAMKGRRSLAAATTVLAILMIVVVPAMLILAALAREASGLYGMIQRGEIDFVRLFQPVFDALPGWLLAHLRRLGLGDFATVQATAVAAFTDGIQYFATRALDVGQSTFSFFIGLFVMLYLLFFVLRDGEALAERAKEMLPLRPDQQRSLFTQFATVVRATVVGDIFVAFVQGALGGLAFWLLGVHAALLWAVLMTFASLLPAIGAALIWLPVAGYFLLSGETWQGIFLIGYGGLVIGLIDNLVRPLLVGQATKMPDYLVLVSTLGGIGTFGLPGFIIGPLIAAMFIAIWDIVSQARRSSPER